MSIADFTTSHLFQSHLQEGSETKHESLTPSPAQAGKGKEKVDEEDQMKNLASLMEESGSNPSIPHIPGMKFTPEEAR